VLSIRSIQDQHSDALTLVGGRVLRCQSLLDSLTESELSPAHEQNIFRLRGTITDPTVDYETQESQGEAADIDDFLDCASQFSEGISGAVRFYTPCASLLDCPIATSSTCYPEEYVIEGPMYERLACFSMIELSRTRTTRVDKCFLLFAQGGRRWRRVTVSATTTTLSTQWDVCFSFTEVYHHVFPYLVQSQLETMLEKTQLYESVTNISIKLQLDKKSDVTFDPERSTIIEDVEAAAATETSMHMEEVEQRGIPQYVESQVVVLSRIRTALYLVIVENQSCIQRNSPFSGGTTSDRKLVDEFIADMKLLQMAQGCPGVAEFVGVVVNDNRTQLCSYLVRYPEAGLFGEFLEAPMSSGFPISWERRLWWIRQIITAVAETHKRGVIIGCLDKESIWVNLNDQIEIVLFKSTGSYRANEYGQLPPEIRSFHAPGALATGQIPTVQSDLFQLGLLVWMLAENDFNRLCVFCRKSGCQSFPHYRCMADHANPVDLPICGPEVPAYVDEIIGHCRQGQPSQRKSACALLALLPADHEPAVFSPNRVSPRRPYCQRIYCNECGVKTTDAHYFCGICIAGEFHLCPKCISRPTSCYDDSHKLRRRAVRNGRLVDEETGSG
jgi:serine/threonine protein kinase